MISPTTPLPVSPIGVTTTLINPPRQTYHLAKPGEVKTVTLGNTDWMANYPTQPTIGTGSNALPAGTVKTVTLGNTDWMANYPTQAFLGQPMGATSLGNTATVPQSILQNQGVTSPQALTPQLEARGLARVLYDPALTTGATPADSPTPRGYAPWPPNGTTANQVSGWPVIYPNNDLTPQNMWQYNLGTVRPIQSNTDPSGNTTIVWGIPASVQAFPAETLINLARLGFV
jgi:hypothetical protein